MCVILFITLVGVAIASPTSSPLPQTTTTIADTFDARDTTVTNYTEAAAILKINKNTDKTFNENIIKYLFQDRASLQERVDELNKDNCDLRTQLSQFSDNILTRIDTEVGEFDENLNYQSKDCTNLLHIIKTLRSEIILESQNHKRNINTLKIEHFKSIENLKMEYTYIINSLKLDINTIKSENTEIIINLKSESSKDILYLRKEKEQLDEDISKLRKLRHEDLAIDIEKSKYVKELLSSNTEDLEKIYDLKILLSTLNNSNILLSQSNLEFIELNKNLTSKNNELSNFIKTLQQQNELLLLKNNNLTVEVSKKTKKVRNVRSDYIIMSSEKFSWSEAKRYCESRNMELAKLETKEERDLLTSYLNSASGGWDHFWLGSTDEEEEEVWKWYGTNISVNEGSTFCSDHTKSRSHNCLTSCRHDTDMYIHSWECETKNDLICEAMD